MKSLKKKKNYGFNIRLLVHLKDNFKKKKKGESKF